MNTFNLINIDGEPFYMLPGQKYVPLTNYPSSIDSVSIGDYVKSGIWMENHHKLSEFVQVQQLRFIKYSKRSSHWTAQVRVYGCSEWFRITHISTIS